MNLLEQLEAEQIASLGKDIPDFKAGDTIRVGYKIIEGTRSRVVGAEGIEHQEGVEPTLEVGCQHAHQLHAGAVARGPALHEPLDPARGRGGFQSVHAAL